MSEAHPLPIYPWPQPPEQLEQIRQAFVAVNPPFAVQPVPASPGEPGRVLAMGEVPPFAADVAYVQDVTSSDQIHRAVRLHLTAPPGATEGFFTPTDFLNVFLGPGVTFLYEEAAPQRVKFG